MEISTVISWMMAQLETDDCLYQDDVVDYLVRGNAEYLCRENSEGNLVVGRTLLDAFRKQTETSVVWVKPDRYWRYRVAEDESGRDASG